MIDRELVASFFDYDDETKASLNGFANQIRASLPQDVGPASIGQEAHRDSKRGMVAYDAYFALSESERMSDRGRTLAGEIKAYVGPRAAQEAAWRYPQEDTRRESDPVVGRRLGFLDSLVVPFATGMAEFGGGMLKGIDPFVPGDGPVQEFMTMAGEWLQEAPSAQMRADSAKMQSMPMWVANEPDVPWYQDAYRDLPDVINGWAAKASANAGLMLLAQIGGKLLEPVGGAVGAAAAVALGQAGPQAAAGEEVATVPAGSVVGRFIGHWVGSTLPMIGIEAASFLDVAEEYGFPRELAEKYARFYGVSSGTVEGIQQLAFLRNMKGSQGAIAKKILAKKNSMVKRLLLAMGDSATEGLEEVTQGGLMARYLKKAAEEAKENDPNWEPKKAIEGYGLEEAKRDFTMGAVLGGIYKLSGSSIDMIRGNVSEDARKQTFAARTLIREADVVQTDGLRKLGAQVGGVLQDPAQSGKRIGGKAKHGSIFDPDTGHGKMMQELKEQHDAMLADPDSDADLELGRWLANRFGAIEVESAEDFDSLKAAIADGRLKKETLGKGEGGSHFVWMMTPEYADHANGLKIANTYGLGIEFESLDDIDKRSETLTEEQLFDDDYMSMFFARRKNRDPKAMKTQIAMLRAARRAGLVDEIRTAPLGMGWFTAEELAAHGYGTTLDHSQSRTVEGVTQYRVAPMARVAPVDGKRVMNVSAMADLGHVTEDILELSTREDMLEHIKATGRPTQRVAAMKLLKIRAKWLSQAKGRLEQIAATKTDMPSVQEVQKLRDNTSAPMVEGVLADLRTKLIRKLSALTQMHGRYQSGKDANPEIVENALSGLNGARELLSGDLDWRGVELAVEALESIETKLGIAGPVVAARRMLSLSDIELLSKTLSYHLDQNKKAKDVGFSLLKDAPVLNDAVLAVMGDELTMMLRHGDVEAVSAEELAVEFDLEESEGEDSEAVEDDTGAPEESEALTEEQIEERIELNEKILKTSDDPAAKMAARAELDRYSKLLSSIVNKPSEPVAETEGAPVDELPPLTAEDEAVQTSLEASFNRLLGPEEKSFALEAIEGGVDPNSEWRRKAKSLKEMRLDRTKALMKGREERKDLPLDDTEAGRERRRVEAAETAIMKRLEDFEYQIAEIGSKYNQRYLDALDLLDELKDEYGMTRAEIEKYLGKEFRGGKGSVMGLTEVEIPHELGEFLEQVDIKKLIDLYEDNPYKAREVLDASIRQRSGEAKTEAQKKVLPPEIMLEGSLKAAALGITDKAVAVFWDKRSIVNKIAILESGGGPIREIIAEDRRAIVEEFRLTMLDTVADGKLHPEKLGRFASIVDIDALAETPGKLTLRRDVELGLDDQEIKDIIENELPPKLRRDLYATLVDARLEDDYSQVPAGKQSATKPFDEQSPLFSDEEGDTRSDIGDVEDGVYKDPKKAALKIANEYAKIERNHNELYTRVATQKEEGFEFPLPTEKPIVDSLKSVSALDLGASQGIQSTLNHKEKGILLGRDLSLKTSQDFYKQGSVKMRFTYGTAVYPVKGPSYPQKEVWLTLTKRAVRNISDLARSKFSEKMSDETYRNIPMAKKLEALDLPINGVSPQDWADLYKELQEQKQKGRTPDAAPFVTNKYGKPDQVPNQANSIRAGLEDSDAVVLFYDTRSLGGKDTKAAMIVAQCCRTGVVPPMPNGIGALRVNDWDLAGQNADKYSGTYRSVLPLDLGVLTQEQMVAAIRGFVYENSARNLTIAGGVQLPFRYQPSRKATLVADTLRQALLETGETDFDYREHTNQQEYAEKAEGLIRFREWLIAEVGLSSPSRLLAASKLIFKGTEKARARTDTVDGLAAWLWSMDKKERQDKIARLMTSADKVEDSDKFLPSPYADRSAGDAQFIRGRAEVMQRKAAVQMYKAGMSEDEQKDLLARLDNPTFVAESMDKIHWTTGMTKHDKDGTPVPLAAKYDFKRDHIYLDRHLIKHKFNQKAWVRAKQEGVMPLPDDSFSHPDEWLAWVIYHEIGHRNLRKGGSKYFDAAEENLLNGYALERVANIRQIRLDADAAMTEKRIEKLHDDLEVEREEKIARFLSAPNLGDLFGGNVKVIEKAQPKELEGILLPGQLPSKAKDARYAPKWVAGLDPVRFDPTDPAPSSFALLAVEKGIVDESMKAAKDLEARLHKRMMANVPEMPDQWGPYSRDPAGGEWGWIMVVKDVDGYPEYDYISEEEVKSAWIASQTDAVADFATVAEVVEGWKQANNIVYDPQEAYERGEGFFHDIGAFNRNSMELWEQIGSTLLKQGRALRNGDLKYWQDPHNQVVVSGYTHSDATPKKLEDPSKLPEDFYGPEGRNDDHEFSRDHFIRRTDGKWNVEAEYFDEVDQTWGRGYDDEYDFVAYDEQALKTWNIVNSERKKQVRPGSGARIVIRPSVQDIVWAAVGDVYSGTVRKTALPATQDIEVVDEGKARELLDEKDYENFATLMRLNLTGGFKTKDGRELVLTTDFDSDRPKIRVAAPIKIEHRTDADPKAPAHNKLGLLAHSIAAAIEGRRTGRNYNELGIRLRVGNFYIEHGSGVTEAEVDADPTAGMTDMDWAEAAGALDDPDMAGLVGEGQRRQIIPAALQRLNKNLKRAFERVHGSLDPVAPYEQQEITRASGVRESFAIAAIEDIIDGLDELPRIEGRLDIRNQLIGAHSKKRARIDNTLRELDMFKDWMKTQKIKPRIGMMLATVVREDIPESRWKDLGVEKGDLKAMSKILKERPEVAAAIGQRTHKLLDSLIADFNTLSSQLSEEEYIRFYRENYIPHLYIAKSATKGGKKTLEAGASKRRVFNTFAEAEAAGYIPMSLEADKLIARYAEMNYTLIANRAVLDVAPTIMSADGDPMVIPRHVTDPDVRMPEAQTVEAGLVEFLTSRLGGDKRALPDLLNRFFKARNDYVRIPSPFKGVQEYWVHPDAVNTMRWVLQAGAHGRFTKLYNGVMRVNNWAKFSALGLSFFHHFSLTESYIAANGGPAAAGFMFDTATLGARVLMRKTRWQEFLDSTKTDAERTAFAQEMLEAGLVVNTAPTYDKSQIEMDLDKMLAWSKEHNVRSVKVITKMITAYRRFNDKHLWGSMLPGMKLYTAHRLYEKYEQLALEQGIAFDRKDILEQIAAYTNYAFGGIEFERYMAMTPNVRKALSLAVFAPDWTISNMNIADVMNIGGGKGALMQKEMQRHYWPWMAFVITALPAAAQAMIYGIFRDRDEDDEMLMLANEQGQEFGIDITPLLRGLNRHLKGTPLEVDLGTAGEKRFYMVLGKQAREVGGLVGNPLKTFYNKSSLFTRMAFEQITGSNGDFDMPWRGEGFWTSMPARSAAIGKKFIPMSVQSLFMQNRPSTLFAPTRQGMSRYKAQQIVAGVMEGYANPTLWNRIVNGAEAGTIEDLDTLVVDVADALRANVGPTEGPVKELIKVASSQVKSKYYKKFFDALNDGDEKAMEEAAQSALRLGAVVDTFNNSMDMKFDDKAGVEYTYEKRRVVERAVHAAEKASGRSRSSSTEERKAIREITKASGGSKHVERYLRNNRYGASGRYSSSQRRREVRRQRDR